MLQLWTSSGNLGFTEDVGARVSDYAFADTAAAGDFALDGLGGFSYQACFFGCENSAENSRLITMSVQGTQTAEVESNDGGCWGYSIDGAETAWVSADGEPC